MLSEEKSSSTLNSNLNYTRMPDLEITNDQNANGVKFNVQYLQTYDSISRCILSVNNF